jgi:hypothetical protein
MSLYDILIIRVTNWQLSINIGLIPLGLGIIIAVILIIRQRRADWFRRWEPVEVEVPFPGGTKMKIKPNHDVMQIAHGAWVQLATRKAGIPFDRNHDVIVEVYNSWYQLFGEMRQLLKQVPAHRIREDGDTQKTVQLIIDALNLGLRPHLTKWQARFRLWYDEELKKHPGRSPQEVQTHYPEYQALVEDLEAVNRQMMLYMHDLQKLVRGDDST